MRKLLKLGILTLAGILCYSMMHTNVTATQLTSRSEAIDEAVVTDVYGSMTLYQQHIKTLNNGITDTSSKNYYWNSHTVQWVDFTTSTNVKIVTYSGSNADKWKQLTTRQACEQWEKENPGWIVLAGINGDFFENSGNTTYQPTGNFMTMGDMYRAEKAGASYRNTIGWNADGSVIVGDPTISSSIYLKKYDVDGSTITDTTAISKVNTTPSATGITLLTKDASSTYDLSGYKVYVGTYEICRISTNGYVFVKGSITSVIDSYTDTTPTKPATGKFYLVSKDGSLDSYQVGDKVKCEYSYTGDWSNVQNSMGYIYQVLSDGNTCEDACTEAFCYTSHPRTLIGFKENGDTVFMVINGRGTEADMQVGASISECGELLKAAGCVSGYNLDGGGSSTLVVRNEYGGFEVINNPSDGSERADGNHVLVVMRDPGFEVNTNETTYNSATISLDITNSNLYNSLSNIVINFNGQSYNYNGTAIEVSGLDEATKYQISVTYDSAGIYDETITTNKLYTAYLTTPSYQIPSPGVSVSQISKNSVVFKKDTINDWIKNIVIHIGDATYAMNSDTITCSGLIDDTEYEVYITYEVQNAVNNKTYQGTTSAYTIKTTNFDLPEITTFEIAKQTDTYINIDYQYKDSDKVVTAAYLYVNGVSDRVLSTKVGTEKVTIDLDASSYDIELVIEYSDGTSTKQIKSDTIHLNKNEQQKVEEPTTSNTGSTKKKCGKKSASMLISLLSSVSILYIILKKRK